MPAIGMTIRALLIPLLVLPGGWVATSARADEPASRWTFGTEIGQVRGRGDTKQLAQAAREGLSTYSYDVAATWGDKDRPGWRVFTGYRFTDHLAIHVGYTDLGKAYARFVAPQAERFEDLEQLAKQSVHGVDVGLSLKVPLSERVDVELHGGRYYWKSNTRLVKAFGEPYHSSRRDSNKFFGAGVSVGVINDMRATVGWTRYEVADAPVTLMTVGILYGFSYF